MSFNLVGKTRLRLDLLSFPQTHREIIVELSTPVIMGEEALHPRTGRCCEFWRRSLDNPPTSPRHRQAGYVIQQNRAKRLVVGAARELHPACRLAQEPRRDRSRCCKPSGQSPGRASETGRRWRSGPFVYRTPPDCGLHRNPAAPSALLS